MSISRDACYTSAAWPFVEARRILKKINNTVPKKGYVLFETGYGPSGLPHIGTFGEVARTSMVKYAFEQLSDIPTKLIVFSDDMDGFRKVPSNVPNQELLMQDLGKPLTSVRDPFGQFESFGEHNNNKLKSFLDAFDFDYEFYSSTACYNSGMFDDVLLQILEHYEEIIDIVLPTLGDERRATYSPFLPVCPKTNHVLQVPVVAIDKLNGTIVYLDGNNQEVSTKVVQGACKLQWKIDWAMRWCALGVDYEMSGKDLISSVDISTKVCKVLSKKPPLMLTYELFLDKNGEKISKSKGNGLSIEDWLRYSNQESLSYFMYQKPQTAKRLYFDIIPKNVDEWLQGITQYHQLTDEQKVSSPIFFIYHNQVPKDIDEISFSMILNLTSVLKTGDKQIILKFLRKYKEFNQPSLRLVEQLIDYALIYYYHFVEPTLVYHQPSEQEKLYLQNLVDELLTLDLHADANEIQNTIYRVGKATDLVLKEWFRLIYVCLLGKAEGPRIGNFFYLYGLDNSIQLIKNVL